MPDKSIWDAPASKGAGDPGVGQGETESSRAEPLAPSEAAEALVKAGEEDGHPRGVGSGASAALSERGNTNAEVVPPGNQVRAARDVAGSTPAASAPRSESVIKTVEDAKIALAERAVHVGEPAVTGTGQLTPDPVQPTSRSASRAGRTLGRLGGKKGYASGIGLQRAASKKKKERETIRVPVKKTDCPRWMHHRAGEYCKTCGKTP